MSETIQLGDVVISVTRKAVKHVYLSVHPPAGHVTLVAPTGTRLEVARAYAVTRLGWIRRQQAKLQAQPRASTSNGRAITRMKTKWGGCSHRTGNLRLNTELVKKPRVLLEYVVVHEMLHLLEPTHGERFVALLDRYYPSWREARA